MRRLVVCAAAACILCGACQKPATRLNAPPHGAAQEVSPLQTMYVHMVDNALLSDMTISDVHFVPHRAMLNSLGEERLSRLALLMDAYGGTIRFSTDATDEELVEQRTDRIREFLRAAGVDTIRPVLRRDMRGGRGMDAKEAILIKAHEGTYKAKKSPDSNK